MKKDLLKELLRIKEQRLTRLASDFEEVSEALDRRRILYDRLANHSTIQKPKSMNEMAEVLYDICMERETSFLKEKGWLEFQELSEEQQDQWMDLLLTILN